VQGLVSDCIQTIVQSRNYHNFDEIAQTAVVEESTIILKRPIIGQKRAPYLGVAPVGK
jgi:hypothetical protein